MKNCSKQSGLEEEANNVQWDDEDTQRSKLNVTKSKYVSVTLMLKYLDSFICFYYV